MKTAVQFFALVMLLSVVEVTVGKGEESSGPKEANSWEMLPRKVDLRGEIDALGVNFRQQGMRNACAAFSATSMLELQLRRLGYPVDLSEQYVLWATQEEGATPAIGLTTQQLAAGLQSHRICLEEFMPYKSGIDIIEPSAEAVANAAGMPPVRGELIANVTSPGLSEAQLFQICLALARYEPVCFSSFWLKEGSKLEKNNVMNIEDVDLDGAHMVLLTGYELTGSGDGYLLLRNSWGLDWGDFGYARMPFEYARQYGLDAVKFSFDWSSGKIKDADGAGGGVSGEENIRSAEEPTGMPPGLPIYFLALAGLYFVPGFLGFGLPALVVARKARSPFKFLIYLLLLVPMLVLLGVVTGNLIIQLHAEEMQTSLLLGASVLGLLIICLRLPMRQFDVRFGRALLLIVIGLVIYWPLQWWGSSWLPVPAYQNWRASIGSMPLQEQVRFALLSAEQQSQQMLIPPRPAMMSAGNKENQREAALDWLKQWEADLLREQQMLQPNQPLAKEFWERRVAAFHQQKRLLE